MHVLRGVEQRQEEERRRGRSIEKRTKEGKEQVNVRAHRET